MYSLYCMYNCTLYKCTVHILYTYLFIIFCIVLEPGQAVEGADWGSEDPLHRGGGEVEAAAPQGVPRLQVPTQEEAEVRRGGHQGGQQEGGQGPEDHQDQQEDQAGAWWFNTVFSDGTSGGLLEPALQPPGVRHSSCPPAPPGALFRNYVPQAAG